MQCHRFAPRRFSSAAHALCLAPPGCDGRRASSNSERCSFSVQRSIGSRSSHALPAESVFIQRAESAPAHCYGVPLTSRPPHPKRPVAVTNIAAITLSIHRSLALDDGLLTASKAAQLKHNADWVVLSACNTAVADKPGGAFGPRARALLASHWSVDSQAATRLTISTFANMAADPKLGRASPSDAGLNERHREPA